MKQLVLKELREQGKVAIIAAIILAIMLFVSFSSYGAQLLQVARGFAGGDTFGLQPLMNGELLVQVSFLCAIFGALLGWLQIHAERHPDLWAFLVHRPIPRTTILRSKIVAGLLLYASATGVPLLGFILFASMPGNVAAPFEWAMALPLCAIFLSGMVYYLAGLLTGIRKARWYASRGLGLGLALVVSFSVFTMPEFWHFLLIVVAGGMVLALAVWGSFRTGGYYREQPRAGKVALTLACTVSLSLVLATVIGFMTNLLISRNNYTYSQYQITRDGEIIKITQRGFDDAEITDLNGQPVLDEKTGQKIQAKDIGQRYATGASAWMNMDQKPRYRGYDSFFRSTRFFSPWQLQNKHIWYLTVDGRLVAYHALSRRFVGRLAPQGTSGNGNADDSHFLRPQNFGYNQLYESAHQGVLASARTAYSVDLEKRELRPVFTVTNGDVIGGCSEVAPYQATPSNPHLVLILTRQSIRLMDVTGQTHLSRPYHPSAPEYPSISVLTLKGQLGHVVRFDPDYLLNKKAGGTLLTHIDWVNSDNTLRQSIDLPKLPEPRSNNLMEKMILPFVPPAFPFYNMDEPYRMLNVLRLGPAILCAGLGLWLGRRHRFSASAQAGWAIFHLLFGLPGLLAFVAVQEWPAQEACPKCQRLRAVDRDSCEHCGAEFIPPAKTGTEIFEPLTTN